MQPVERIRIESVNIGKAERILFGAREYKTGIVKRPTSSSVTIDTCGLANDIICDEEHHGGQDQAVYAYSAGDYQWWSEKLGREIEPGSFGDNLTISGLPSDMNAGDRLLIGEVILEATAPRIPCSTLAAKMQDSSFGMTFRRAERPGFYFRVLNGGQVMAGDSVTMVENPQDSISMLELFRLSYEIRPTASSLQRALGAPIAARMRKKFESKLEAVVG